MATAQTAISARYVMVFVVLVGFIVVLLCESPFNALPWH